MKKIIKIFILSFMLLSFYPNFSYWETWKTVEVKVSEKVPWANCVEEKSWTWASQTPTWYYICTIPTWFDSVQSMIWEIIKWITAIAALWWVLFIVINWILLSMWWDWADEIKKRIKKTIIWLILLLLSWLILSIIAPWVYR